MSIIRRWDAYATRTPKLVYILYAILTGTGPRYCLKSKTGRGVVLIGC